MTAAGLVLAALAAVLLVVRESTRRTPPAGLIGVVLAAFATLVVLRIIELAS